jgi:serine-type D-Ala-D-Ala carboxypeptidase (penicillin-binding protein 5/6)
MSALPTWAFGLLVFMSTPFLPTLGSTAFAQGFTPLPPVTARNWLLFDLQSQQIIGSKGADERIEPASLTKLMTAYVVFGAIKQQQITLEQKLPVSTRAWKMPGSRMFLAPNSGASVDALIKGMIVVSGNDATVTLAEGVAGSEEGFVKRMNDEGQRLGMKDTRFANASGLPGSGHYSTASDLTKLTIALLRDFPEYLPLYSERSYTYGGVTQPNRNSLLGRDPRVDGLKTGHTENAGFCLIATAHTDTRRLMVVVAGTSSESARAIDAQKLLNYGFQYYDTVRVYGKGATIAELPVWKGSERMLKAGFDEDVYLSLPRGDAERLKATLTSQQPLLAPVSRQQQVGMLRFTVDGKPLGEYPVVALEAVSVANLFVRVWDTLHLLIR